MLGVLLVTSLAMPLIRGNFVRLWGYCSYEVKPDTKVTTKGGATSGRTLSRLALAIIRYRPLAYA